MVRPVGYLGGFFDALGPGGVAVMLIAGAGYGFFHAYVSSKVAAWRNKPIGAAEPELITCGLMTIPIATFAALRYTKYAGIESDALDFAGNVFGAGLLWETWNAVETIIAIVEEA